MAVNGVNNLLNSEKIVFCQSLVRVIYCVGEQVQSKLRISSIANIQKTVKNDRIYESGGVK